MGHIRHNSAYFGILRGMKLFDYVINFQHTPANSEMTTKRKKSIPPEFYQDNTSASSTSVAWSLCEDLLVTVVAGLDAEERVGQLA